MSEHDNNQLDPQQRLARDAVRSLGVPAADPAFRARLKEQFTAGAIADVQPKVVPLPRRLLKVYGWGTLAAAAVITFAVLGLNRLPGPELVAVSGAGTVVVDGRSADAADPAAVAALLHAGGRLELRGEATLDLQYPGSMVMRVAAGTDVTLPERPGRWFARTVSADLAMGEISVRTGPDLAGGELDVHTPTGDALITGTLINVMHNGELTCFCLHDGTAHVHAGGTDLGAVPPMKRRVVFADGREPMFADIAPPHLEHMLQLEQERGGIFDRSP